MLNPFAAINQRFNLHNTRKTVAHMSQYTQPVKVQSVNIVTRKQWGKPYVLTVSKHRVLVSLFYIALDRASRSLKSV